uniref:Uncharacterized protein ylbA n=2 Tax=Anthurium amnicola TaxID=1678845 RepID=A0A1D1ZLA8_9ARAE
MKAASNKMPKKERMRARVANWTTEMDSCLVRILKKQFYIGRCNQGTFSKDAWKEIVSAFKEATKLSFDKENCYNRWKTLRKDFILHSSLANRSGWTWDYDRNVAVPGDQADWNTVLTLNPGYHRVKNRPFIFYKDFEMLCEKLDPNGFHVVEYSQDEIQNNTTSSGASDDLEKNSPFPPLFQSDLDSKLPLYWKVIHPTLAPAHLQDLPGFTRSVCRRDHAIITPESHVFSPLPNWINTLGAYLITPAMGSHFSMYLVKMQESSMSALPPHDVERFFFVIDGTIVLSYQSGTSHSLPVDSYAYLPANSDHALKCEETATLVVFERRYVRLENHVPEQIIGSTDRQPVLETPGEVFQLRKLLPTSASYDFNIHIMDFLPGEYLNVKEVHYNQHGLLLLAGQGIFRLGDSWYPIQAGDAIWMAPFIPQWYAALGKSKSRYLLYKDVNRNPL